MRLALVILLFSNGLLAQESDSVLYRNIYRNYGAELHPESEKVVSYRVFGDGKVMSICTYHPTGSYYRDIIDSIATPVVNEYNFSERGVSWQDISSEGFYYVGSDVYPYDRVDHLPYPVLQKIHEFDNANDSNYLEHFLNMDIRSVCTDEVDVFDGINGAKEGYLVRGDLVEVIVDQGDWVHIKYLRTDKEYWTHKSCLE